MFSGKNGSVLIHIGGDLGGDLFGSSVAGIGDINGDTHPDIVVGAPQPSLIGLPGYIKIVSGKDGKQLARLNGLKITDRFGTSVSGAGDLNGDKIPDILVGVPRGAGGFGYVAVISGKDGTTLATLVGRKKDDEFGSAVDGGVDVNGDGKPDILVGAQREDVAGADSGAVHLISGKDGKTLRILGGAAAGDWLGSSVALGGDVDNDGTPDILAGARNAKGNGAAFAFSGKDGKLIHAFFGDSQGDSMGASIGLIGDLNEDGHADFIAGAPDADDTGRLSTGMARVFSGKDLTLWTDVHALSLKKAGVQKLSLAAGTAHANRLFHVFGSVTGTSPGVTVNGLHIPLNVDMYTSITLAYANSMMFGSFRGKLDGSGTADASFQVPAGLPSLSDMTLFHSFVVYDASGAFHMASNPATLRLEN